MEAVEEKEDAMLAFARRLLAESRASLKKAVTPEAQEHYRARVKHFRKMVEEVAASQPGDTL